MSQEDPELNLFPDETIGVDAVKLTALESLINLVTRDCAFSDFMTEVLNIFIHAVKSEAGSILEVDKTNQTLFFRAMAGTSIDKLANIKIPIGQGISGHVAESFKPVVVANVPENKVHLKSIAKIVGFEPRALVAIPLIIRGKIYGVLELLNRVGEATYSPADVEVLVYLASMSSKIIELRLIMSWAAQEKNGKK